MKFQKYATIILCLLFVLIFSFWCFFVPTPDYSYAERRSLAKMPAFTWQTVTSGEFAKEFEEYTTDRFPLRDAWRSIKAYSRFYLFGQKENNNIFVKDGHIAKIEYPENRQKLDYATSLFTQIHQKNFPENEVYVTVVPDKNKYLADLKMDYDALEQYVYDHLDFAKPIPIAQFLSADDYYYTDSHWRQEQLIDIAAHLSDSLGTTIPESYQTHTLDLPFYGVYAGQSALIHQPDTIRYLTNSTIDAFAVTGAQAVYDTNKAAGNDPYEFFLSGNQPLITITNPTNTTGKRLIVFRDSFSSSLMPLLAQGFSEVTLIDLRYMHSSLLEKTVDFSDAQILFIYSSHMLNNSLAMK